MLDFHEKRKLRSFLYSKPAVAVLLAIAVLLSMSVYERYQSERDMAAKRQELEGKLVALKNQAATLEEEVERLKSDRGIEEELRDRFEVAKSGEDIVIIVDGGATTSATTSSRYTASAGFWSRLSAFFSF